MAIVSGPEPQRGLLKNILIQKLKESKYKSLIVCGETESEWEMQLNENVHVKSHLGAAEMHKAISSSSLIIARSGYSTIMDLAMLGKKVIFIPTPGQTEQAYLAQIVMERTIAFYQTQENFNLEQAIEASKKYRGFQTFQASTDLEKRIEKLLC